MKIVILLFVALILFSLFSALFHLVRDKGRGDASVRALTWRIGLSITLFLLLMAAYWLGWIGPRGLH